MKDQHNIAFKKKKILSNNIEGKNIYLLCGGNTLGQLQEEDQAKYP